MTGTGSLLIWKAFIWRSPVHRTGRFWRKQCSRKWVPRSCARLSPAFGVGGVVVISVRWQGIHHRHPGGMPPWRERSSREVEIFPALEIFSYQVMIAPLAPALPPWGAGARCDALVVPKREISRSVCTGNTAQSQPGDTIVAGAEPPGASLLTPDDFPWKLHGTMVIGGFFPFSISTMNPAAPERDAPRRINYLQKR